MSPRYIVHQVDSTQKAIIDALEAAGWEVFTRMPCDMFCYKAGVWRSLEAKPARKSGKAIIRRSQVRQSAFLARTNTPIATTPEAALIALGSVEHKTVTP